MPTPENKKKAAPGPAADWHWKDVLAALHKAGYSLRQIGLVEGYPDGTALGECARRPYPKAEAIIARYLGTTAASIWPSRYGADGQPNRRRGPAPMWPANANKDMPTKVAGNPQARAGA
jgi:Ner family transcriptional regulator